MKRDSGGPCLSAVFVDYDNIYLSLKRKSEEAAKRFAKESMRWLREIEGGNLITATNASFGSTPRRIVMNRCYGNPVPRRNAHDNSTDMSSFPFVRHHFLRAGFEVIDCPPLTAQLKNSADIRMVMDIRDLLLHDTYFDEFIIMSGDADFTPVLIRLRAHARRTVVFANDFTAAPYTAICDGEVREAALIDLILAGDPGDGAREQAGGAPKSRIEDVRREILSEVIAGVRASATPVPLEALADRALRALGHERTIATGWAGAGSFRELLRRELPDEIRLTGEPPYLVFDARRHRGDRLMFTETEPVRPAAEAAPAPPQPGSTRAALNEHDAMPASGAELGAARARGYAEPAPAPRQPEMDGRMDGMPGPVQAAARAEATAERADAPTAAPRPNAAAPSPAGAPRAEAAMPQRLEPPSPIQQSIARIQEACQAPPLAPQEYRALFEIMAGEIDEHDPFEGETLSNITRRAQERGIEVSRDDARFVLEVVSEADPWFEQGVSADLFASRFRTFVVARCRGQGLNLNADELDLIDAWFLGTGMAQRLALRGAAQRVTPAIAAPASAHDSAASMDDPLPRVVRTGGMRG
ncbi:MAG TPA: NYN domain-containing protein [Hyphomicrobiaceae bacterium]|nr:NYN domain-containing protein [Hyphomicrobiaceae bacterium]